MDVVGRELYQDDTGKPGWSGCTSLSVFPRFFFLLTVIFTEPVCHEHFFAPVIFFVFSFVGFEELVILKCLHAMIFVLFVFFIDLKVFEIIHEVVVIPSH